MEGLERILTLRSIAWNERKVAIQIATFQRLDHGSNGRDSIAHLDVVPLPNRNVASRGPKALGASVAFHNPETHPCCAVGRRPMLKPAIELLRIAGTVSRGGDNECSDMEYGGCQEVSDDVRHSHKRPVLLSVPYDPFLREVPASWKLTRYFIECFVGPRRLT